MTSVIFPLSPENLDKRLPFIKAWLPLKDLVILGGSEAGFVGWEGGGELGRGAGHYVAAVFVVCGETSGLGQVVFHYFQDAFLVLLEFGEAHAFELLGHADIFNVLFGLPILHLFNGAITTFRLLLFEQILMDCMMGSHFA